MQRVDLNLFASQLLFRLRLQRKTTCFCRPLVVIGGHVCRWVVIGGHVCRWVVHFWTFVSYVGWLLVDMSPGPVENVYNNGGLTAKLLVKLMMKAKMTCV